MLAIKTKIRFVISVGRAGASPAGWKSDKSDADWQKRLPYKQNAVVARLRERWWSVRAHAPDQFNE